MNAILVNCNVLSHRSLKTLFIAFCERLRNYEGFLNGL